MTDDKRFTEMNLFTLFLIRESSKQEYETLAETDPIVFGARRSIAGLWKLPQQIIVNVQL